MRKLTDGPRQTRRPIDQDSGGPTAARPVFPGFREYLASTNSNPKGPERQRVARLEARWQLARSYQGLRLVSSHDRRTVRGYEALLRVTLAYSTLDQFEAACGQALTYIEDKDLANKLRNCLDVDAIRENEKTTRMKRRRAFDDIATTADVAVFARALRHMFAHGSGTPWGVDAKTNDATAALSDLSERLLVEVEHAFKAWVDAQLTLPSGGETELPVRA